MSASDLARATRRGPSVLAPAIPWKAMKRWLYIFHRWTGIVLCLFFAIWFLSGLVMLYVSFPSFRASERVATAAPIDWRQVRVGPDQALATLGEAEFPNEMRLGMTGGEPVYRFVMKDGRRAISARSGREIQAVDARRAGAIASVLVGAPVQSIDPVDHDQWVVTRAYKAMAPFWRVRLADRATTDIYVSQRTGEVVQNTTAHERFWNWLGAVPHWIYFEALRLFQEPWRQTVLWISGVAMFGAVAGFWIGVLRVRLNRRYKSGSVSPYRGWMKWHHVVGLLGGLFLVGWVFSGWLSMSPWGGLRDKGQADVPRLYARAQPVFPAIDPAIFLRRGHDAREIRFAYLGGLPIITIWGPQPAELLDGRNGRPIILDQPRILAMARNAMPGARLVGVERLEQPDRYWYSTGDPRDDSRPLPILRLKFVDPARTWLHIDPATGALLGQLGAGGRSYRWLFNALHSLDLPWLLIWPVMRHVLIWFLSIAGVAISVSGMVIGWRRLFALKRGGNGRKGQAHHLNQQSQLGSTVSFD
ncbi:PepSY domain-containing protein [Sphingobium sp. BYY-5]|uniref:PepSY domain-containing protein n=1 Tax=Sphingobium sp. BYY-5 TaxID=2926400 RepID=UPI001FA6F97A|nr:PepSY domain-containing protein [Sphingobium sp. BYY-5]MCI4592081.1 PepSY domain-containing protein [Sphingobium sp. BYY-5]